MFALKKFVFSLLAVGLLTLVAPAWAQGTRVQIAVDAGGDSTRVVLTHGSPVAYEVRSTPVGLEVLYAAPIRLSTAEQQLGDPILDRYELRDGRRILLQAGPGYRSYETFELRNPFRLVIDLQGTRGGSGAIEPVITLPERPGAGKTIVVLDPGHGGAESGATGPSGLREKEITLDLARSLKQHLGRNGGLHVVLTRDEDRALGLDERTAIANHNRADLFVSIHVNSSPRASASGAETYFLSTSATDDEARTLAALENQASGVASEQLHAGNGDRRGLDLVLWDLAQNQYLAESSLLAESMQRKMNELTGTRDRGVRQAPFRVLMGATMPAILVEVGFISNAAEERKLRDPGYRSQIVQAMAGAVRDYLSNLERLSAPGTSP